MDSKIVATSADQDEWMELGNAKDFAEGSVTQANLPSGFPLAVYRVDGDFYVTSDRCTHGAASLSEEGELDGHVIECAWHYGTFDVRTGSALTLPCRAALPTFDTRIEGERVLVKTKPNKRQKRN
jgi:nitrite reductase/ring-hydroxylating ferredoxin subunit